MVIHRIIGRGEKINVIINEVKGLTLTNGTEHAVVKLVNGQRAIVSGGTTGIRFPANTVSRIFGHTHPYQFPASGVSSADRLMLDKLGQISSYLLEHGDLYKFTSIVQ